MERELPVPAGQRPFEQHSAQNPTWTAPENLTGAEQACTIGVTVGDGIEAPVTASYSQAVRTRRVCTYAVSPLEIDAAAEGATGIHLRDGPRELRVDRGQQRALDQHRRGGRER